MQKLKEYFISATSKYCELYNHVNAPYIRKSFELQNFSSAKLYITGLGFYELFVNGKKLTKGKLAPYISNPDQIIYYDEYDLTKHLNCGKNAIGVILGNGFLNNMGGSPWGFDKAPFRSAPKLSLMLEIDGKEFLHSDNTFKTYDSPIYFDDLRCGEYYNANLEQNWLDCDFCDSDWNSAIEVPSPNGKIAKCTAEPIKMIEERNPVNFFASDGGIIFDFGKNSAGICKIKINSCAGRVLTFWHCEALTENHAYYNKNTCTPDFDRYLSQKDVYVCKEGEQTYEPSFTYHGFRYVFVEGISLSDLPYFEITMLVLSSALTQTGTFRCDNEVVNQLQNITLNSDLSNFFYFPTDCPQREKNGWTGDAVLSAEQLLYNLDCANSLTVWLENIRASQRENGMIPAVVPTVEFGYSWGNGPGWDMVAVELPYQIYKFTGKKTVLQENVPFIAHYLRFLSSKVRENGTVCFGLPDWCEAGQPVEHMCSTPTEISDTLISIEICQKAKFIFSKVGDRENETFASDFEARLRASFRNLFITEDCYVSCKSQTAQAKALSLKLFTAQEEKQAFDNLLCLIREKDDHFSVGVFGARVLFRVLADFGYADLALELITKDTFPSYKYWLDNGATSLWEAFNELYPNGLFRLDGGRVLSLNHHFWGDISAWFYRYVLGINVNPSMENEITFEISPALLSSINYAEGSYVRNGKGIAIKRVKTDNATRIQIQTIGGAKYVLGNGVTDKFVVETI